MHKDANLRRRNALTIPGGLLAAYSLAGMAYVALLRGDGGTCGDASLMVFAGACRSAVLVLGIPLVLGLALAAVGALKFRNKATCRHGHGSWTHFTLALLVSLVLVPALGIGLAPALVGEDAAFESGGVRYPVSSILGGLSGLGVLMLLPFAILYSGQVRANPCCVERGCFAPCFCDELAPEHPAEPAEARDEPAMATAAPAAPAREGWVAVAEGGSDTSPPPSSSEAVRPPSQDESSETATATTLSGAPALASRPADPAAPPSDEMAAAVEWAQVDGEAEAVADATPTDEADGASASGKPARRRRTTTRPAKSAKGTPKKSPKKKD